jgi:ATP-dependent DNA helicase RecG
VNVRPEKLLDEIGSRPHNPLIANAFFRSGQIELWGRGIEKMKKGCVADGLQAPEFDITASVFSICFHIRNNNKAIAEREIYSANNGGINCGINCGINEQQQSILKLFSENPTITTQATADSLGISKRSVDNHIRELKRLGLIEREGAKKNGRWIVK